MRWNHKYALAFILLFLLEACIALFVRDRFIRPYVGDVLVVILLYCFVMIFLKKPLRLLPLYLFLFAAAVELLQLLDITEHLGLANNIIARVMIGTTFDWRDILCYAVGSGLLFLWQARLQHKQKRAPQE